MFTKEDLKLFEKKGIKTERVEKQIACFKKGFPFSELVCPALPGNGITTVDEKYANAYSLYYDSASAEMKIVKMVPASGAASRMFSNLYKFSGEYKASEFQKFKDDKSYADVFSFIEEIRKFAFFDDLATIMKLNEKSISKCIDEKDYNCVIEFLLGEKGLNYGNLPKGLIKFHQYEDRARTAFEEHLAEGALYCSDKNGNVYIHFTISPEHVNKFEELIGDVKNYYEEKFKVKYEISYSVQKPSTDTIAVNVNNEPFRESDGTILFRPGGHGALIENLNDLDAEIVFVKNIDNIVPDKLKDTTTLYKKVIGGILLEYRETAFEYLEMLDSGNVDEDELKEITAFCINKLMLSVSKGFEEFDQFEKIDLLYNFLNRPMRVCGMVKNEGEPGGGPFWVKDKEGRISLQIVESSQIDLKNETQKSILGKATHFNPVDLVCSIKNYKGEKFDLNDFIDQSTGFISSKSKDGKQLKALELPGLWNGAMAEWITIFVDVPLITFNPVKTVNDLLREEHQ
jgi:hypothetical protein